jgi:hypothetical protein
MKLPRMSYEPGALADFYEEALGALGALCDRCWHDRLDVAAEGRAAALWPGSGPLHLAELRFAPPGETAARDPVREVFPGCPLTFALAEALRPSPLVLERIRIAFGPNHAPEAAVAEKLWRSQFPDTVRWQVETPFHPATHYSVVALVRCEIQAIDQHWSLHRVALNLPGGGRDEDLARRMDIGTLESADDGNLTWPNMEASEYAELLRRAIEQEIADDLGLIRERQKAALARELERIDRYFDAYARELEARVHRNAAPEAQARFDDRLAAARSEHARHRADQAARHEILVRPHVDALLLVAEPAWKAGIRIVRGHQPAASLEGIFVPRSRRWSTR